jgi:hypothetical protein
VKYLSLKNIFELIVNFDMKCRGAPLFPHILHPSLLLLHYCSVTVYQITFLVYLIDRAYISELYGTLRGPMTSTFSGSIAGMVDGSSSLRRTSSLRRSFVSGAVSLKRRSVGVQVKYALVS